jgi:uncharacterized protein YgiM (DUF1202 family)
MADWNSLKPLRLHRRILSIVIFFLLAFLIFAPKKILSTENNLLENEPKVVAKSGLKMRNEPSLNSEVIATVGFNENVKIVDKEIKSDIINGQSGKWYKIEYENKTGYAWNKFISE